MFPAKTADFVGWCWIITRMLKTTQSCIYSWQLISIRASGLSRKPNFFWYRLKFDFYNKFFHIKFDICVVFISDRWFYIMTNRVTHNGRDCSGDIKLFQYDNPKIKLSFLPWIQSFHAAYFMIWQRNKHA